MRRRNAEGSVIEHFEPGDLRDFCGLTPGTSRWRRHAELSAARALANQLFNGMVVFIMGQRLDGRIFLYLLVSIHRDNGPWPTQPLDVSFMNVT